MFDFFVIFFTLLTPIPKKTIISFKDLLSNINRRRPHIMKQWLKSQSICSIILMSFVPFILLILLTYYAFYRIGSEQLKRQTYENAQNINEQICTSLNQDLNHIYKTAMQVISNPYFFQLKQNIEENQAPAIMPSQYQRLYQQLDNLISSTPHSFSSISLFIDDRSIFVHRSNIPELVRDISFHYEDYTDFVSSDSLTWVLPKKIHPYQIDSYPRSSLGLMMLLGNDSSTLHGFILFEINDDILLEKIQNAIISPSSQFNITCGHDILLNSHNSSLSTDLSDLDTNLSNQFYVDRNCYFYTPLSSVAKELQLGILSQVPVKEISLNQNSLTEPLFIIILLFLVFCGLTYFCIYYTVSRPLIQLNHCLTKSYDITLPVIFHISGSREIETITKTLNRFWNHIQHLVQNLNHEMDERRIAELNILYEQINPHFLYNTLDTIYQLCDMGEVQNAKEMTNALATFYRIGVSKGANFITLEEECTHAEVYLSIMKIRFENFTYEIHLPDDLKYCSTIKKILQPLLENAIYHGIQPLYDKPGHISINISDKNSDLEIIVSDNGIGIPEHELNTIQYSLTQPFNPAEKGKLYGLKNVHARIQLTYHAHYGITIISTVEDGTTIKITIPKVILKQKGDLFHDENTFCR